MYLPFDLMPPHSRVWVYQANRAFSKDELESLKQSLTELCQQWKAHGHPLSTSFIIKYDQFIILAVDETLEGASGCSIDGTVHFLKSLQKEMGLDFFDRTIVAFQQLDEKIITYPLTGLKTLFDNKILSADTLSFNNAVTTKAEWENNWRLPVVNSWLSRYLPKTTLAR